MRFRPLTPDRLVDALAAAVDGLGPTRQRVAIDGAEEVGAHLLADAVAERLSGLGRQTVRICTQWWWRPASVRLEWGRTDVDMLLGGWLDAAALTREVLDPLAAAGSGRYLRRLRDPNVDRSIRERSANAGPQAVMVLDGPFLLVQPLPLDVVVHLQVGPAALRRAMTGDRAWWLEAFHRYHQQFDPAGQADLVVAYDHPGSPALGGAVRLG